jgi:hypothetical protein
MQRMELVPAMRALLVVQAFCMGAGIWLRQRRLSPEPPEQEQKGPLADRLAGIVRDVARTPGALRILAFWILANIAGNFWRVYFSLFAVQKMGWSEASLGGYSQLGAAAFVAVSLYWLPRLRPEHRDRDLFWVNLFSMLPPLLLLAGPGLAVALSLNISGGVLAALNAALTAAVLSSLLPQNELALSFSLGFALMQLLCAASFPAVGAWFRDDMGGFAVCCLILNAAQAALAYSLFRSRLKPA